ncbi:MAG TPA: FHA domain-containing protein [Bacillota bacterium]|nr:FHA domain-containing protein [Bacillota bacterium]
MFREAILLLWAMFVLMMPNGGIVSASTDFSGIFGYTAKEVTVSNGKIILVTRVQEGGYHQTDTPFNPGNWGGAFVDEVGRVSGINTVSPHGSVRIFGTTQIDEVIPDIKHFEISFDRAAKEKKQLTSGKRENIASKRRVSPGILLPILIFGSLGCIAAIFVVLTINLFLKRLPSKTAALRPPVASSTPAAVTPNPASTTTHPRKNKLENSVLLGLSGLFADSIIELQGDEWITIGRDPLVCQLVYPADTEGISRNHCRVMYSTKGRCFFLEDMGSSCGTYVSAGIRLYRNQTVMLAPGARFYLADTSNAFEVRCTMG